MTIEDIRLTVHDEFLAFSKEYDRYTLGDGANIDTALLNQVEDYLCRHQGKRLRPLLVLLSAKACGHLSFGHIMLATAMEMLHNATLMHDDVVDESDNRRGSESIKKIWGNQVAVLCGDYYLAQAMSILQKTESREASILITETVATMSRGELAQLYWTAGKSITQDIYLNIIGSKTASLMSTCCELGALSLNANQPSPYRKALHDFGYHYGLVFQMLDDLADEQTVHDIQLPSTSSPQTLIDQHKALASTALKQLPDSPSRNALENMLHLLV